jgi:hypothetical protein
MGIGTGSGQCTFIRWNWPQGEHAGNPTRRQHRAGWYRQTMV